MLCPVLVSYVLLRYVKSGLVRSRQSGQVGSCSVMSSWDPSCQGSRVQFRHVRLRLVKSSLAESS